jgi:hypothetical protein
MKPSHPKIAEVARARSRRGGREEIGTAVVFQDLMVP